MYEIDDFEVVFVVVVDLYLLFDGRGFEIEFFGEGFVDDDYVGCVDDVVFVEFMIVFEWDVECVEEGGINFGVVGVCVGVGVVWKVFD